MNPLRIGLTTFLLTSALYSQMMWAQSWDELPKDSQTTLHPLRGTWSDLSDAQKQSCQKRVPDLKKMPPAQLEIAHTRMAEWSALSQKQRQQVQEQLKSTQSDPETRARIWKTFTGQ